MATKNTVIITDDLDGSTLPEDEAETVEFTYGGQAYEIDLSKKNVKKLDDALAPFIDAARKVRATTTIKPTRRVSAAGRDFGGRVIADVRAWAAENGYDLSSRGRIPQNVLDAYDAAH